MNVLPAALALAVSMIGLTNTQAQRGGITAVPLHTFDDASMPGKEFRVLRTTRSC
jgi:hypothetical protein